MKTSIAAAMTLIAALASSNVNAGDAARLGAFIEDPPTLICLGFCWRITGDDNRNATADVFYRKQGDKVWKQTLPLLRTGDFHVGRSSDWLDHKQPPMLAGSILDLEPDTAYEVRITAKDPDGVAGQAGTTLTTRTRAVPKNPEGGMVYHCYPPDKKSNWTKNEFGNLYKAYYSGLGCLGDFNMVWERIVQPGDVILVHGGVYKANLRHAQPDRQLRSPFNAQPVYNNPTYFIRNVTYSCGGYKFHEAHPSGLLAYHNTVIDRSVTARETFSNTHFRNNLVDGGPGREPESRKAKTIPGVTLDKNTTVRLDIKRKHGREYGRVDCREFVYTKKK